MNVWKMSSKDLSTIRQYAREVTGLRQVMVEVGERYNVDDESQPVQTNLMLLGECNDDLWDKSPIVKGEKVPLTENGEAELDFYVYEVLERCYRMSNEWEHGDLFTNIQAHVKLDEKGKPYIWKMTEGRWHEKLL